MGRVAPASGTSKERLERISHHFLSGPEGAPESAPGDGPAPAAKAPLVVPVLTVPGGDELPLERLSRALLARGRSAAVLDARGDVQSASRPNPSEKTHRDNPVPPAGSGGGDGLAPPADTARLVEAARALDPVPALCLVPLTAEDWPVPDAFARPLLAVATGGEALRAGFLAVKQAHAGGLKSTLGVLLTHAPDAAAAARHFDALAEALWRFLGLEAVSYGCLPAPPAPHAAVDLLGPGHEARLDTALAGVARLLAADLPPVTATRAKAGRTA